MRQNDGGGRWELLAILWAVVGALLVIIGAVELIKATTIRLRSGF